MRSRGLSPHSSSRASLREGLHLSRSRSFRRRFEAGLRGARALAIGLLASRSAHAAGEYAVIVNAENPVSELSWKELVQVFKAERQYWSQGERIELLLPRSSTQEKGFLLDRVYGMTDSELKRYWVELVFRNKIPDVPKSLPSAAVLAAVVSRTREAIALVDVEWLDQDSGVRVLAVDGKRPGESDYPLRDLGHREQPDFELEDASAAIVRPFDDDEGAGRDDLERRVAGLEALIEGQGEDAGFEDDRGFDLGPLFKLRGFMDVRFGARSIVTEAPGGDSSTDEFALGQLDLFVNSQLDERTSFLSEIVFDPKTDGSNVPNVERAILKHDLGDSVNIQAGRFHTTIGYWNEAYHHGEWLQTTIGRPQIVNFGGLGGVLPIHLIGVVLKARTETRAADFDTTVEIGNGRGPTRGSEQVRLDANDVKALNVSVGISPGAVPGLRFGGGVYVDDIPPNTNAAKGPIHGTIDERILSAFATYQRHDWQILAELFDIDHDDGSDATSDGYYVQVGRRYGDWTPYVRLEGLHLDDGSTFFENRNDLERTIAGLRWDLGTWHALKLQLARSRTDAAPGSFDEDATELAVQWSYAF